jgi:hypothetical protein
MNAECRMQNQKRAQMPEKNGLSVCGYHLSFIIVFLIVKCVEYVLLSYL